MSIRETVLSLLEKQQGAPLSGNRMSQELGVSRAAVWKAVKSLQEDGYAIEAVKKKGYRLQGDILSAEAIRAGIADSAFWKDIRVFRELGSTNTTAKELAGAGAESGTVILAEKQTAGRGRLGRSFFSPPQSGLYMSVILRLPGGIEESMQITSAAAVAVCRAIRLVAGLETQIKWVNDIYYNGKKLCGILTEAAMSVEAKALDFLVIGIGINITGDSFPPELRPIATSLETALDGKAIVRSQLAAAILNELQGVSGELDTGGFLAEYKQRSCVLGRKINVISLTATEPATALDINEKGNLIVQMEDGTLRTIHSGEISIRPIDGEGFAG